jgi:hypothetical protein
MIEQNDITCHVRESFSGLRMDVPVEDILARSRARRRRRLSGLTVVTAATATAATAMTLTLGGPAPISSGNLPAASPGSGSGSVRLAAFSVTNGPGESTTLVLHKGSQYPRVDPSELRQALARHGIPALVTVGTFCRSAPGVSAGSGKVVDASNQAEESAMVINGQAIPPGTRLSIGLFPGYTRMLLIKDDAPLACSSTNQQPAAHIIRSRPPIRGSQGKSQDKH